MLACWRIAVLFADVTGSNTNAVMHSMVKQLLICTVFPMILICLCLFACALCLVSFMQLHVEQLFRQGHDLFAY